jgi:uncharacterized protein (DUF1810 family)
MNNTLTRFLEAQEHTYSQAFAEVKAGRKQSHWMWFIFPQLKGLGLSATSEYYGIKDINEAKEYLAHPVLGGRLREICTVLLEPDKKSALGIFGMPDYLKLKSCLTLFAIAQGEDDVNQTFEN